MNTVLNTAHSTAFHIKDNPYLPHSSAIKFLNSQHTIWPITAHSFSIQDRLYLPCSVATTLQPPTTQHTPCTSTCTTHFMHINMHNTLHAHQHAQHTPCTSTCTTHSMHINMHNTLHAHQHAQHTPCTSTCTTHSNTLPTTFLNPPMHTTNKHKT